MTGSVVATRDPSDATLVASARDGDLYAWEHLVRRYQESMYRVAYLVVRATDLAEAATQSAFIRAYRALPSLDADAPLMPWLFRIVAGEARQQRRESARPKPTTRYSERSVGPQVPASPVAGVSEAADLTPSERAALSDAFERLGEDDRLTLAARYLFGLSTSEAAAALSLGRGLVDERLTAALKRLRARLASS